MPPAVRPPVVDLAWLVVDRVPEAQWPDFAALLDAGERARMARFRFAADARAYLAAHALLRGLLARRGGRPAADWRFAVSDRGKPEPIMPPATPADGALRVSLSHTRGVVAAAVTRGRAVGVDVEARTRRGAGGRAGPAGAGTADLALAQRYFAPEEAATLARLPTDQARAEAFLAFWTVKEAVLKALGRGLSLALDAVVVRLDPLAVTLATDRPDAGLGPEAAGPWALWRCDPTPDHTLALAVWQRLGDGVPPVRAEVWTAADLLAAAAGGAPPAGGEEVGPQPATF